MTRRRPVPEPKPVPPDLILEAYDGDYRWYCPVCGERSHWTPYRIPTLAQWRRDHQCPGGEAA